MTFQIFFPLIRKQGVFVRAHQRVESFPTGKLSLHPQRPKKEELFSRFVACFTGKVFRRFLPPPFPLQGLSFLIRRLERFPETLWFSF